MEPFSLSLSLQRGRVAVFQVCGWDITQIQICKTAPTWCIPCKFKHSFLFFMHSSVNWITYTGEAVNKLPGSVYSKLFAWCYFWKWVNIRCFGCQVFHRKKLPSVWMDFFFFLSFFFLSPSNATTCSYELRDFPSWLWLQCSQTSEVGTPMRRGYVVPMKWVVICVWRWGTRMGP